MEESPPDKARIHHGDIIYLYDSEAVTDTHHLRPLVTESIPNTPVKLRVLQDGKKKNVKVTIVEMLKDMSALGSVGKASGEHALAGITVKPALTGERGVKVTKIDSRSLASQSRIQAGDIIFEINSKNVKDVDAFQRLTREIGANQEVLLLIRHGRRMIFLSNAP
ncbi:MAG: hypothetical protein NPIRA04_32700 [Nitrospirales bacterium]|nr:MAG: hypothetical protein NPIRA04_32700 [Nitrospirales bacterium]